MVTRDQEPEKRATDTLADLEALPDALKSRRAWVVWKEQSRNGKPTKVPYAPVTGRRARTNDPSTWTSLATARRHLARYDGLGIVLGNGLVGVDLDHCRDPKTGDVEPWAWDVVATLDSYTEVSPSGTGLHVLLLGGLPAEAGNGKRKGRIELYAKGRYFTVTGLHVEGTPVELNERSEALAAWYSEALGEGEEAHDPPDAKTVEASVATPGAEALSDEDLLAKAQAARNGAAFARLWSGDTSGHTSASEADEALCCHLAFWTGNDPARIDRLFRQSGLMRPKWDRADYRERTITAAVAGTTETYTPRPRVEVKQAGKEYDPRVDEALKEPTDSANGTLIAALYGDRLRWDRDRERWLVWGDHWWVQDKGEAPLRLAMDAAKFRFRHAWDLPDETEAKHAMQWALASRQHHRLIAALQIAKALAPIEDKGAWDTSPSLLGVANGVVDLRTGELLPGDREQRITRHLDLAFDATACCPRWERLVLEVCDEREGLANFVRIAAGYSLTGETSEQCLFVLHGRGSTGKSTLLAHLTSVIGPYARTASFEAFADPPGHSESLAVLDGGRFVTCAETRENTRLNEQRLKVLAHGNDRIAASFKYGHEFRFTSCAKLWLALNHKPRVQDDSTGFWRSVRLIPFDRVFDPQAEPDLDETLDAEAAGILAWLVRAARDWYSAGLPKVAEVLDATQAWEREANPLGEWLEDRCVEGEEYQTVRVDLWESYLDWCEEARIPQRERLSERAFSRRCTTRWGAAERKHEGRWYRGVGLRDLGPERM